MSESLAPSPAPPKLGLATKLNYGLGALANGVGGGAALPVVALYANQVLGLRADLVGLTIGLSVIVDAVLDPLIGRWSDGVRSPWGRRHPFMYASALPTALGFYFLWHPPLGLSPTALLAFMLIMQVIVRVSISLYDLPNAALAPELAPDYHDRTGLLSFRTLFGTLGGGVMTMLLYGLFLRNSPAHPVGILNRDGYAQFATLCAVVMFAAILISSLATHGNIRQLSIPPQRKLTPGQEIAEWRAILTNRPFMVLVLSFLISGIAGGVGSTLGSYFYLYFWGLSPQMLVWITPMAMVAIVLAAILAPILTRRFDKKPTMIALFVVSAASGIIPLMLRLVNLAPPNGSLALLVLLMADGLFSGLLGVAGLIIVASMISDVVEDVAVKTGVRSEGLLFSALGLLPKFTAAAGAVLAGMMLTAVHFPAHAQPGSVAPGILRNLALMWLPFGVVLQGISIAVLLMYRLDRSAHERNLDTLAAAASLADQTPLTSTPIGALPEAGAAHLPS